jgi:hypothetical protein
VEHVVDDLRVKHAIEDKAVSSNTRRGGTALRNLLRLFKPDDAVDFA